MTQFEKLSKELTEMNKQLDAIGDRLEKEVEDMRKWQEGYLESKTKVHQTRAELAGIQHRVDESLSCVKNLARVALGEFVPLHGDPDAH